MWNLEYDELKMVENMDKDWRTYMDTYLLQARYSSWECYEFLCNILSPFPLRDYVIFYLRRGSCSLCSSLLPSLFLQLLMLPNTPFTATTLWMFLLHPHATYLIVGPITTLPIIQPYHLFKAYIAAAPKVIIHSLSHK